MNTCSCKGARAPERVPAADSQPMRLRSFRTPTSSRVRSTGPRRRQTEGPAGRHPRAVLPCAVRSSASLATGRAKRAAVSLYYDFPGRRCHALTCRQRYAPRALLASRRGRDRRAGRARRGRGRGPRGRAPRVGRDGRRRAGPHAGRARREGASHTCDDRCREEASRSAGVVATGRGRLGGRIDRGRAEAIGCARGSARGCARGCPPGSCSCCGHAGCGCDRGVSGCGREGCGSCCDSCCDSCSGCGCGCGYARADPCHRTA